MELKEKIQLLKESGFDMETPILMVKTLTQGNDRFTTQLYVYIDEIDVVYINRYFIRGLETISEDDVLRDHNSLNTNAKNDYVATMKKLPFLSSYL